MAGRGGGGGRASRAGTRPSPRCARASARCSRAPRPTPTASAGRRPRSPAARRCASTWNCSATARTSSRHTPTGPCGRGDARPMRAAGRTSCRFSHPPHFCCQRWLPKTGSGAACTAENVSFTATRPRQLAHTDKTSLSQARQLAHKLVWPSISAPVPIRPFPAPASGVGCRRKPCCRGRGIIKCWAVNVNVD